MSKIEFLDRLRMSLNGQVSASTIEENIRFYEDYINTEMRKGKSEAEVLQMLGDPRLIARTIIQTSGEADEQASQSQYRSTYRESADYGNPSEQRLYFGMPKWLFIIVAVILTLVVIAFVFSVLSVLAPVLIVMAVVIFLVKLFRDWLN